MNNYLKVKAIILSCVTIEQILVAQNVALRYLMQNKQSPSLEIEHKFLQVAICAVRLKVAGTCPGPPEVTL